jgi:hypothetical protein
VQKENFDSEMKSRASEVAAKDRCSAQCVAAAETPFASFVDAAAALDDVFVCLTFFQNN